MSTSPPEENTRLGYSWYVVIVLTSVYMLSFVDRTILGMLIGPIQADLGISDTQFGVLSGFMFTLFYVLMGVPLGRVADTYSRRNLVVIGVVAWSFFTSLPPNVEGKALRDGRWMTSRS